MVEFDGGRGGGSGSFALVSVAFDLMFQLFFECI